MLEEHLSEALRRYEEVMAELSVPETHGDSALLQRLLKEQAELSPLVSCVEALRSAEQREAEALSMLGEEKDEELRALVKEELWEARREKEAQAAKLKELLLPKDPNDEKNVVLEIRAGAGGDEAALFAAELFRMYRQYAEHRGWKVEIDDFHESGLGGMKEVIATVRGRGAFSRLKFESGVHRVQRVPATESQGRIHTSAAGVLVFPEVDEPEEIEINQNDLKIDVYRSSGPGGQSVNTTDSAVRITHLPTGIVVAMQNEKSQLQNREAAMRVLRARLLAHQQEQIDAENAAHRASQVRTMDRSERIRTYNFPENRIADHRTGYKAYNLDAVLNGDLEPVVQSAIEMDEAHRLAQVGQEQK